MTNLRSIRGWLLGLLLVGAASASWAQTTTGTILGDVKDATGASLPGVTVTAVNQGNGLTREAVSDEVGAYRFTAMPPGVYTVKASLTGFKEATRADLRLAINSQLVAPFTLEVGGLEETITVTEQAPLVDTTENVVRTLVDTQQIASLAAQVARLPRPDPARPRCGRRSGLGVGRPPTRSRSAA